MVAKKTPVRLDQLSRISIGCLACGLDGKTGIPIWDDETNAMPLCRWHLHGMPFDGHDAGWFLENIGPSYHRHKRAFQQAYGSDDELLAMVNELIGEGEA